MPNFWFTAARIARRETRASAVKFVFVVLGVAAAVGALSGVRGFSEGFRSLLLREARQIMAGRSHVAKWWLPDDIVSSTRSPRRASASSTSASFAAASPW